MPDRTCTECPNTRLQARGFCAKHYQAWKRANAGHTRTCTECGKTYRTIEARSTVCSRACRSRAAQRGTTRVRYPDRVTTLCIRARQTPPSTPLTIIPPSGSGSWTAGTCLVCNMHFVSRGPSRTCSEACRDRLFAARRRDNRQRYRARQRNAYVETVNRLAIFARDQNTCQLCGELVLMSERAPHPLSPTIDHVVPLALGGSHEPTNVQLAHFICNCTKRDQLVA